MNNSFRPIRRPGFGSHEIPKAHDKDPRALRHGEYSPLYQADEEQFRRLAEAFRCGYIPLETVIYALKDKNEPPQLNQVPFVLTLVDTNPQILIPGNLKRLSFIIGAPSGGTTFLTYGPPPPAGIPGLPIQGGNIFQEANGTVSIDDIYVSVDTPPLTVLAYEGTLAL